MIRIGALTLAVLLASYPAGKVIQSEEETVVQETEISAEEGTLEEGETSESEETAGETSAGREELLQAKLGELVSAYGIFQENQSGVMYNHDDVWFNPAGILGVNILDYDADGESEMLVCISEQYDSYGTRDYYHITLYMWEVEDNTAVLADSMVLGSYIERDSQEDNFQEVYYSTAHTYQEITSVYSLLLDGQYCIFCENCLWGSTFSDGSLKCYWILTYTDGTFQFKASFSQMGEGSGYFAYTGYKFENGSCVSAELYYSEWGDETGLYGDYTEAVIAFFNEYGVSINSDITSNSYGESILSSENYGTSVFELIHERTNFSIDNGATTAEFAATLTRGSDLLDVYGESESTSEAASETSSSDPASEVTIEEVLVDSGSYVYQAVLTGHDSAGATVWTYTTESYYQAQLTAVYEIGIKDDTYYFVESGTVTALNLLTGEVLWKNSEFGGSGGTCMGENGIYLTGYLNPDFFAVSYSGETLKKIDVFDEQYFWSYNVEQKDENTLWVYMEGSLNEGTAESVFSVDLTTWEYQLVTDTAGTSAEETSETAAASDSVSESAAATDSASENAAAANYITVQVSAPDGGVNMRVDAGVEYTLIYSMIPNGTILTVTAQKQASNGNYWGYTTYAGYTGWIAMTQVTQIG
ncbi:MAG: hypothetical protein LUG62_00140 [Clostridiales bacterium]|nr:hypothetical protein [Clostridiales bacterium]